MQSLYPPDRPSSPQLTNKNMASWIFQIMDPGCRFLSLWDRVFLAFCLLALFVDPFYFYLPKVGGRGCLKIDRELFTPVTILRSLSDFFYYINIILKFRTAFVLPGSTVIGKGELVMDSREIAVRYLNSDFKIDFSAAIPLPQILQLVIWLMVPERVHTTEHANNALSLFVLIQYVPRFFVIFPLQQRIIKNNGFIMKTAWAGVAYNLFLYILASHVFGASWYLLAIQRQYNCWSKQCRRDRYGLFYCQNIFLDCKSLGHEHRESWLAATSMLFKCDTSRFDYGIYADGLTNKVFSAKFYKKFLYCLWWGLKNLSSYGQNLKPSRYVPETAFCILTCIGGLVLFCHLVGNIQTYLQSVTARVEEWRIRRRDTEEWMRHRRLPLDLQKRVRQFVQYKWLATRGVDEDAILHSLPPHLRRDIQRHLCLDLVRRVPFFSQMDNQLVDAICEGLVSSLSIGDTFIVREGDPVDEMLFIIRGQLESSTTDGGRSGFFNSIVLKPGDFCGEELLTWALMPNPSHLLPSSTRTVRALCEVEAFALRADDLKYVANQFKRLHSMKLQHVFRYYSHQWRTWGACFIQAAWRRFKKRKLVQDLKRHESLYCIPESDETIEDDFKYTAIESSSVENMSNDEHIGVSAVVSKFVEKLGGFQKNIQVHDPDDSKIDTPKVLESERYSSFHSLPVQDEPMEGDHRDGADRCLRDNTNTGQLLGATLLAIKFALNIRGVHKNIPTSDLDAQELEHCGSFSSISDQNGPMEGNFSDLGRPMEGDSECTSEQNTLMKGNSSDLDGPTEGDFADSGAESISPENKNNDGHLGATVLASMFAAKLRRVQKEVKVIHPDESRLEMLKLRKPNDPYSSTKTKNNVQQLGATILASKFAAQIRVHKKIKVNDPDSILEIMKLQKPNDPDFSKEIDSG